MEPDQAAALMAADVAEQDAHATQGRPRWASAVAAGLQRPDFVR